MNDYMYRQDFHKISIGKKVLKLFALFFTILLFSTILTIPTAFLFGYNYFFVLTPSSAPTIPASSIIVDCPVSSIEELSIGDFITCKRTNTASPLTHHVVAKTFDEGEQIWTVTTQQMVFDEEGNPIEGIVEGRADAPWVLSQIVGKVIYVFPTLGIIFWFIYNNLFLVIASILLLYIANNFFNYKYDGYSILVV